jgi:hypothetical protein
LRERHEVFGARQVPLASIPSSLSLIPRAPQRSLKR